MNRRGLITVVGLLASILVGGLVYVFASSLWPTERARALAPPTVDVSVVGDGQYRIFVIRGEPIFVFRPTAQIWKDLRAFDSEVQDTRYTNYYPELGVFIYYGVSTLHGCLLKLRTKDNPGIRDDLPSWPGGYYDPCHGAMYDYAGRAVKVGIEFQAMRPVPIRQISGTRVDFY